MRTDADDPARVRDPAIELLLSHTATLTDEWCPRGCLTRVVKPPIRVGSLFRRAELWTATTGYVISPRQVSPTGSCPGRSRRDLFVVTHGHGVVSFGSDDLFAPSPYLVESPVSWAISRRRV